MNDAESFWSKVDTSSECWTWLACGRPSAFIDPDGVCINCDRAKQREQHQHTRRAA